MIVSWRYKLDYPTNINIISLLTSAPAQNGFLGSVEKLHIIELEYTEMRIMYQDTLGAYVEAQNER